MLESILDVSWRHLGLANLRQQVSTHNIANINQPTYRALQVREGKSEAALEVTPYSVPMRSNHIDATKGTLNFNSAVTEAGQQPDLTEELQRLGDNLRRSSFDAAVLKSFHRMLTLAAGG